MKYEEIIGSRFCGPAAILSWKGDTLRILSMNQKYIPEMWMNVTEEEFLRAYPDRFFDEENRRVFLNAIRVCSKTGEEQMVETWRSVLSDCCGFDRICLKSKLIPVEQTPDEFIFYEAIRNITNEKRTQNTLEDVEYRYKSALEQINIYNWEYTIATKEMRPCYRCMRDLGLPALVTNYPEPAIDAGIFPEDYADMYREMMHKVDEGIPEIEADIPLTVGRVPFRVKYTTSFDENGKPVKAFGSATLISEKELGHIKLDNQIITALAEGYRCIYLADLVNDTVKIVKQEKMLNLPEGSNCRELFEYVVSKLRDLSEEAKKAILDKNRVRTEVFADCDRREFVSRDEETGNWIRIESQVIERSALGVDRLMITSTVVDDYRAQKMDLDRQIARQKTELEDRQKMLLTAVDEANRANRAKTEFFSNMSHDIRTPMNAIMGFSKLAMEEMDHPEQVKDYLEKIDSAGDHLLKLINDILDMSRIESGKMELSLSPASIRKLLLECADMIRVKMDEKHLRFEVDVDQVGEDTVDCDKLRFNQVILNLLSNSYKFTPEGGTVSLFGKLVKRSDKLIYEIRVKDTGIGMSEEFQKHIWEAFSREQTATVHETQGTGLGMLIVKSMVNLMHGSIDVQSKPGEGSEFIIELPLNPVSSAEAESALDQEVEQAMNLDYSDVTILVVDDTPLNLKLAEHVLAKFGFRILTTDNGINAIERVQYSKPGDIDLVLMDVNMPVMDGLEATRRIRALENPDLAAIPIIAMTANAFESDVKDALDAGMNAHVPKPFTRQELIKVIHANLK
jgi:signal transduction histidine kinase